MVDRPKRRMREAGFTLLEVLVALGLLGLVLAALTGGLRFGVRAWQAQETRQAGVSEIEAVHALLRRIIVAARPLPLIRDEVSGAALYVDGGAESIGFVTALPEAIGQGGPYDVVLERTEDGRLVLRWRPHVRATPGSIAPSFSETELLRGLARIDIRYFVPAVGDQPAEWVDTWRRPAMLPALVEIRLRFANGDRRRWTNLVVAPLLGAPWG